MELIDHDEMDDFLAALREKNLPAADFEFREIDTTDPKTDEIYALQGFLTIIRKSTKLEKQYPIGDGSKWIADFHKDLEDGVFG